MQEIPFDEWLASIREHAAARRPGRMIAEIFGDEPLSNQPIDSATARLDYDEGNRIAEANTGRISKVICR